MKPLPAKNDRRRPAWSFLDSSRRTYAVLIAVGITAIAVLVALKWGPSWWNGRELSGGAPGRPGVDYKIDILTGQEDGPSSPEGPAAEFEAELYGIAAPLVEKLPNSAHAHWLLASVHQRFARREKAAREFQKCRALDPTLAEAHHSLGLMALNAGDHATAEKHFRDAFDINPQWADVSLRFAQTQISQGKFQDAILTLQAYLATEPTSAEAWCCLGKSYQHLGDHANAKRSHLAAIEMNPDSTQAHYGVAKALRELDATEESREYFEKVRQMRHANTASVRADKATWTDEGRVRKAIVDTATKAGAVYAMHGYLAEAEKCWTKVVTLDPTQGECLVILCRLKPDNPEHWLSLGRLYIQYGRLEEAETPFLQVITLAPQRADGYAALAEVYTRQDKNAEEAFQLAQTAVRLEWTATNYFVLAATCERLENWSGANSALEHAIKLDPDNLQYREAHAKLQKERRP